jgi:hypothetical protein
MVSILSLGADSRAAVRTVAETLALPRLEPGWVWLAGAGPAIRVWPLSTRCTPSPTPMSSSLMRW